jgi:hypothetical protein
VRERVRRFFPRRGNARTLLLCTIAAVGAACWGGPRQAKASAEGFRKAPLTANEIVGHLLAENQAREMALRKFHGTRVYRVDYHGFFGTHWAEAVVNFDYASPDHRGFAVVSQTGSKFLFEHVIKGLLNGEEEAGSEENRRRTALTTGNYRFTLADDDGAQHESEYALTVVPKTQYKYLYRGEIWVDARDFAVTRIEAEPAKSPSFWVKRTEVHHTYEKVGNFWLPASDKSQSWIRMGGVAELSIEYKNYTITDATPVPATAATQDDSPRTCSAPSCTAAEKRSKE